MPWTIDKNNCIRRKSDNSIIKCHNTPEKAVAHLRALNANVDDVLKKMMLDVLHDDQSSVLVEKEDDRYKIVVVSTAAVIDREDETFTTKAMDFDIKEAYRTNTFPEFRVFHSPILGIGRVTKMSRVGIFAIDEGYSYKDEFSLSICENMLMKNDGRWRASRGFSAIFVAADCPLCDSALGITKKHMLIGFRCPVCKQAHLSFKGMPNIHYMKARTFDVTITDVPSVMMTSAAAFRPNIKEDNFMNKKQLKQRLLGAGIDEELVDARLDAVTDEQLKEFDSIPDAHILKHLDIDSEKDPDPAQEEFVLADGVLAEIAKVVRKEFEAALADFSVELDTTDLAVELKESHETEFTTVKEAISALQDKVGELLADGHSPSGNGKKRLHILKGGRITDDDEDEDEDEEFTTKNGTKVKKSTARWFKDFKEEPVNPEPIVDGHGNQFDSMSEFVGNH